MPESLKELSDRAPQGEWTLEEMPNDVGCRSNAFTSFGIEAEGKTILDTLNATGIYLEKEPDGDGGYVVWDAHGKAVIEYVLALVREHRAGLLHDDTALATAVARARREALEEVGAATGNDEWAVADTTGLRHLRMRLEGALANRNEEGDLESVSWLSAGIKALGDALIYAAERDRERRGRLIAEARYEPWRQESKRLEKEMRATAALAATPPEARQTETSP